MINHDIYEAAKHGDIIGLKLYYYFRFLEGYGKNSVDHIYKFNVLQHVLSNNDNEKNKLKMIKFLIKKGVNVNYIEPESNMIALHFLYSLNEHASTDYLIKVTRMLLDAGINVNIADCHDGIPLDYAIASLHASTEELMPIYEMLIKKGSNYLRISRHGKSSMDLAKELSYRKELYEYMEEIKDEEIIVK